MARKNGIQPAVRMSTPTTKTVAPRPSGKVPSRNRRNRKERHPAVSSRREGALLTDCAILYAAAVADPFGTPAGACVPDIDVRESFRTKVFLRGNVLADVNGDCFVALAPLAGIANDVDCLTCPSAVGGVGLTIETDTATSGIDGYNSNSLFTNGQFGSGQGSLAHRPVAWGLRWRSTAQELDIAGAQVGYTAGGDIDTMQGATFASLLSNQEVEPVSISSNRKWFSASGTAAMCGGQYLENGNYIAGTGTSGTNIGAALTVLMAQGAINGSFEWEAVLHYEVDGEIPGKLPSHCDPIGVNAVDAMCAPAKMRAAREVGENEPKAKRFVSDVVDYVEEGVSGLISWAAPHVKTAAKDATLAALTLLLL